MSVFFTFILSLGCANLKIHPVYLKKIQYSTLPELQIFFSMMILRGFSKINHSLIGLQRIYEYARNSSKHIKVYIL